jgi:hypothetical protein
MRILRIRIPNTGLNHNYLGGDAALLYIAVCGTFSVVGLFENVTYFIYRFILTPSDITVQGGASATLKCSATGVPNPSISWQKDRSV